MSRDEPGGPGARARPALLFLSPTILALTGGGLAMRAAMMLEALAYGRANPAARPTTRSSRPRGSASWPVTWGTQCRGMPNLEIRHARA